MKINLLSYLILVVAAISCKQEPTGPETNCHLLPLYRLTDFSVDAAKVFNVSQDPPIEIKNGSIEYDLSYQWADLHDDVPTLYPYPEYFIDSIEFINESSVRITFFERNFDRIYDYSRDDCELDLDSPEGKLHLELTHGGDEISEQRFAIYEHRMPRLNRDTFLFIEFMLGPFNTYEEIIKQFAMDHPGQYDTVAIERVRNKTKE